jgi:metal-sulfur cluster biosynthetic enzyme
MGGVCWPAAGSGAFPGQLVSRRIKLGVDVMPDESAMLDALREVVDPELMINVVDLGLVYGVAQEGERVKVEMTLTSPACPAGPQIVSQAKMALEKLEGVAEAEIKLVLNPPWTPDRMTDEARDQLGIF